MDWSAVSPDMNPMENVWSLMKRWLKKSDFSPNADTLLETLWHLEWINRWFSLKSITINTLEGLGSTQSQQVIITITISQVKYLAFSVHACSFHFTPFIQVQIFKMIFEWLSQAILEANVWVRCQIMQNLSNFNLIYCMNMNFINLTSSPIKHILTSLVYVTLYRIDSWFLKTCFTADTFLLCFLCLLGYIISSYPLQISTVLLKTDCDPFNAHIIL